MQILVTLPNKSDIVGTQPNKQYIPWNRSNCTNWTIDVTGLTTYGDRYIIRIDVHFLINNLGETLYVKPVTQDGKNKTVYLSRKGLYWRISYSYINLVYYNINITSKTSRSFFMSSIFVCQKYFKNIKRQSLFGFFAREKNHREKSTRLYASVRFNGIQYTWGRILYLYK